jgi:hypothetical protein
MKQREQSRRAVGASKTDVLNSMRGGKQGPAQKLAPMAPMPGPHEFTPDEEQAMRQPAAPVR